MQKSKKVLSLALALVMALSLLPTASLAAGTQYDDMTGHWAASSIERWSEYKIVEGADGHFYPDHSLTRGEMAKILANTLGLTDVGETNPFADLPTNAWYTPYVLRCAKAGIMEGDGVNAKPTDPITRQETMTVLGRALSLAPIEDADLSAYGDAAAVADWAKPYVAAMTKSGIVKGVGGNRLAPAEAVNRASIMVILDRAVTQYINAPGTYDLAGEGLVLVAAGDVTLTGSTKANILVTPAAEGKALTFDKADVTGTVTVLAKTVAVTSKDSTLPAIEGVTVNDDTVTVTPAPTATPQPTSRPSSGGGGGGGGSYTPSYSNLTVTEAKTVDGSGESAVKTYQNVTITAAVGDGTVTLSNMTILGNLYINGGGAGTINLTNVVIKGKIIMAKAGGERPRLNLTNTPVTTVEVDRPATIEADAASAVAAVQAKANVYVIGSDTAVTTVTVPSGVAEAVVVSVTDGTVATVEAKSEVTVSGSANAVKEVKAEAPVTVAADAVEKVEVPAAAKESVTVAVTGTGSVEVAVNSDKGATITTEADESGNKATVEVSSELDALPDVTLDGEAVEHIHKWGAWEKANDLIHERVCKTDSSHTETAEHQWGEWSKLDDALHVRTCTVCGGKYTSAHKKVGSGGKAPTCTEAGWRDEVSCTVCKQVLTERAPLAALGHDLGGYETDADNHWRQCSRCDAIVDKAAHTYPAGVSCDTASQCTVCQYEKAAGAHTWGAWKKVDTTNHKRTCSLCGKAETAAHAWDDGVVTTAPTETESGVKTWTCTDCKATKTETLAPVPAQAVWYSYINSAGSLSIQWGDANLASGEYYGVNGKFIGVTNQYWLTNESLMDKTASETFAYKITKGTYDNGKYTPAVDIGELTLPLTVAEAPGTITAAPQADGTYLISGGGSDCDGYFYRLKDPDGKIMGSELTTLNGILNNGAPYEGCTIEVSQFKFRWGKHLGQGESKWYDRYAAIEELTVTRPQSIAITAGNLPIAPAEPVNAGTLDELKAALNKGGTVNLTADITIGDNEYAGCSVGAPSVLNLNGHTITSATEVISFNFGKEITIDGTVAGSGIYCTKPNFHLGAYGGAKLTINGGSYSGIGSTRAREVSLNNVTVEDADSALFISDTPKVTISGGSFSVPYSTAGTTVDASISGCADVSVTGAAFDCWTVDIMDCANATISGCTFACTGYDFGCALLIECSTATLENNTGARLDIRSMWQAPSNVTVKSGTYPWGPSVSSQADSKDVPSTLTILGGTFPTSYSGRYVARLRDKANLNISGGDFTSSEQMLENGSDPGTIQVSGGTFGFDPSAYLAPGSTAAKSGTEEAPIWTVSQ